MTVTSNEEFAKRMMLLAQPAERFRPTATYDPDGDCVEFLASPDPFYAERVDDLVTVYYSQETNEVIGSLVKGVSKFCATVLQRMPGFRIEIRDGRVSLEHIFRAALDGSARSRIVADARLPEADCHGGGDGGGGRVVAGLTPIVVVGLLHRPTADPHWPPDKRLLPKGQLLVPSAFLRRGSLAALDWPFLPSAPAAA